MRLPREMERREEKREKKLFNLFSLLLLSLKRGVMTHVLGTKFYFLATYSVCDSAWWWHSWETLMGTITQLGKRFPSADGKK